MQPTIVFTAPVPSMISLNGRFAGEAGPDMPLMVPVAPFGALYAEYMPLAAGQRPTAFKCVFSGGQLLPDSISGAPGVFAIQWPGNILEIEINCPEPRTEHFSLGALQCSIERGSETILAAGNLCLSVPEGALKPMLLHPGGIPALKGDIQGGGQYMITLSRDMSARTGFLTADRIDTGDGDILHAMIASGDIVGHGRLEQWMATEAGLQRLSSEPVWTSGGPMWPCTADDTMIAALQAALEGLYGEAENYFVPALGDTSPLNAICDICDLCLPMKYGLPDSRACVGMLRTVGDNFARITPLYYRARPGLGTQGNWQIEWLSME